MNLNVPLAVNCRHLVVFSGTTMPGSVICPPGNGPIGCVAVETNWMIAPLLIVAVAGLNEVACVMIVAAGVAGQVTIMTVAGAASTPEGASTPPPPSSPQAARARTESASEQRTDIRGASVNGRRRYQVFGPDDQSACVGRVTGPSCDGGSAGFGSAGFGSAGAPAVPRAGSPVTLPRCAFGVLFHCSVARSERRGSTTW